LLVSSEKIFQKIIFLNKIRSFVYLFSFFCKFFRFVYKKCHSLSSRLICSSQKRMPSFIRYT